MKKSVIFLLLCAVVGVCLASVQRIKFPVEDRKYYYWNVDAYLVDTGDTATGQYNFGSGLFYIDDANDKVGIGTVTPTFGKLEIYGNGADTTLAIHEDAGSHKAQLHLRSGGGDTKLYNLGATFFIDVESLAQAFTILTDGKVGIGTNAPDSIFHIKANFPGWVGNNYAGQLIIQDPDDSVFGNAVITGYESDGAGNPDQQLWYLGSSSINDSNIIFLNRRNSKLQLGTNGVSRLTILGNGNVGIGEISPQDKLEVNGTVLVKDALKFTQDDGAEYIDSDADGTLDLYAGTSIDLHQALTVNGTVNSGTIDFDTTLHNTLLGYLSGASITSATDNVLIGESAGSAVTEGARNVAIGYRAGLLLTTGFDNFCLGYAAGETMTTQQNNIWVGSRAGRYATGSALNIGIGYEAGKSLELGSNVAIGGNSLATATSAVHNLAIGTSSLNRLTTGDKNVGIGSFALFYNLTGSNNVGIGNEAGFGATGQSNSNNVFIGNEAGHHITTGSSNVFLGNDAGHTQTALSNLLIIDNQERADPATEITNAILYGVMAAAPANQTLRINAEILGSQGAAIGDGTNQLLVSSTGVVTMEGTAKRDLTLRPDLDFTAITAQGKPTRITYGAYQGYSLPTYAADEELFFNTNVPGRWDGASDITLDVLVCLSQIEDIDDDFNLQLSWANSELGEPILNTTTDVPIETNLLAGRVAAYDTYEVEFTIDYDADAGNHIVSHDDLALRLRRLAAAGVEITGEVIVLDYHLHFTVDKNFKAPD